MQKSLMRLATPVLAVLLAKQERFCRSETHTSLVSPEAPKCSSLIVLLAQEDANVRALQRRIDAIVEVAIADKKLEVG